LKAITNKARNQISSLMTMNEIVFKIDRIDRDQPLRRILKEFREAVVSHWCNNGERDIFEIRVDQETSLRKFEKELMSTANVLAYHVDLNDKVMILVKRCDCYSRGSIAKHISESNCLLMPPVVYNRGWEHYKIVSFRPEDERKFFNGLKKLADVEILSKTRIFNTGTGGGIRVSILSLFSRMTDKQLNALLVAYEQGYYKSPRRITTEKLAKTMVVTRPTYEEHLRKAENKIISAIAPYLRLLYFRKPSKPPLGSKVEKIP